jgi:predicted enzyme related to lactoylglutathione lyase
VVGIPQAAALAARPRDAEDIRQLAHVLGLRTVDDVLATDNLSAMVAAAILYVKDLAVMHAFYEECFGMSAVESGQEDFCVLESGDWELSLVRVPAAIAATFVVTDPPRRRANVPVKLAFEVASIDGLRAVVTRAGGQVDPSGTARKFRGRRLLDCLDPEGNVVQLRQLLPPE